MKKKFLFVFLLAALIPAAMYAKNNVDYELLAKQGTEAEIRQAFKENRNLSTQVFGTSRETFLMLALKNDRDIDIISLCLEKESNPSAKTKEGKTPLMYAAQYSSDQNVIDLVSKYGIVLKRSRDARVLQKDKSGMDSFAYARMNPEYSVYQKLTEYTEDPQGLYVPEPPAQKTADVPTTEAAQNSEQTASVSADSNSNEQNASNAKQAEIQQYASAFLLDYAENEDKPAEQPPANKTEYIENPNAADKNGVTLLMRAAKAGNDWDVNLLLKNGADVNLRDKDGWTALMYAVRYQNNLNILNMLIENAAYIRVRNKFNATPLLMAADYSQNPEIISVLLKNRSVSEDEVFRAFIFAITGNSSSDHIREAKIKLFLDMGIPLNRLWKGQTPLMYAAQYGKSTLVLKQLIDAGANPALQDENGNTAFEYAKANKNLAHDDIYWSLNGAN
ncbi:MAG: ankyrin repeat domain-containing protein [Treponema succinifaciens]|uniref:ankyrin repeat domain-containing protein n=1 Tax=Treponema succinifaciens TaxID=167 RepID=UPI0023F308A2|nr:ankyrin repeat domain-containing protein [Treponema succinifaciens]MDD6961676.1 ankyrin repeat domain-containing protein [Treponema succinifaciens]MDY5117688.1 ankyrin repeat domain-containing protein [Treponema succinifaciens]